MIKKSSGKGSRFRPAIVFLAVLLLSLTAAAGGDEFEDFSELTLEEMLNVTVTSATKVEQSIMKSPNAIAIVTAEDIRRSGVRTIPEALRLAPGVYVARKSGNTWEVTIGGFANNSYSNKLLVLIDGVSVYTSIFGGVEWGDLPVTLDEIERIEVIRGTGGVLYGANASNGVINIITRAPDKGARNYVNATVGTQGERDANAGTSLVSEDGKFAARLAVAYRQDQGFGKKHGQDVHDGQRLHTVSLRTAAKLDDGVSVSLDGRFRGGERETPMVSANKGDNTFLNESSIVRVRIDQHLDSGAQWYLQYFYTRKLEWDQEEATGQWDPAEDNIVNDVEFQNMVPFEGWGRHRLIWGGGYRKYDVEHYLVKHGGEDFTVTNAFLHDEWAFTDQLILNAGVKWEHVSMVDPTWQWRAALLFIPVPEHSFRVSAANSFRSPSIMEQNMRLIIDLPPALVGMLGPFWPAGEPMRIFSVLGDEDVENEEIVSYEFGYRGIWFERVNVDLGYGYKQYDNLISSYMSDAGFMVNWVNPAPPPPVIPFGPFGIEFRHDQDNKATSHTVELGVDARLTEDLRLLLNYAHVDIRVRGDNVDEGYEKNTARNFGRAGLLCNLPAGFMMDLAATYVDEVYLQSIDEPNADPTKIDAYWRLDARLAQRVKLAAGELEWGLVGTDLGQEWHAEYIDTSSAPGTDPYEVRRAYYGYLEYRSK